MTLRFLKILIFPVVALFLSRSMMVAEGTDIKSEWLFPRIERISWPSTALGKIKQAVIIHPEGETNAMTTNWPVLFFFHGLGRNCMSFIAPQQRNNPELTRSNLLQARFFVVLPDGEDGWYVNSPVQASARYLDYIDELVKITDERYPVSKAPAHRGLGGWSMGGYGSMHYAETRPEQFSAVGTIIGVLDFPRPKNLPEGQNFTVPLKTFGTDTNVWNEFNPVTHVQKLQNKKILLITADKSFDRTMNQNFAAVAKQNNLAVQFKMLKGGHSFEVVSEGLPMVLNFMQENIGADSRNAR